MTSSPVSESTTPTLRACGRNARDKLLGRVDELLVHAQNRKRIVVIGVNDAVDLGIELLFCHVMIRPVKCMLLLDACPS